jgi:hypothetical protein
MRAPIILPDFGDFNPQPIRPQGRSEDDRAYLLRLAQHQRVQRPLSREALRAQRAAELVTMNAEIAVTLEEIDREKAKHVTPRIRDRYRRVGAWWAKMVYTNGYKTFAYEFFQRQIRGHLTPAEQAVFFLIFDRTVWWTKEWETIRISQFVNGSLPRPDGSRLFTGTGLSERAVQSTLKALVADGAVRRRDTPYGNGLQDYALPRVDLFHAVPRFDGVNISYEGRFFLEDGRGGGSWETLRV